MIQTGIYLHILLKLLEIIVSKFLANIGKFKFKNSQEIHQISNTSLIKALSWFMANDLKLNEQKQAFQQEAQ